MKKSRVEYFLQTKNEIEQQLHEIARVYNHYFPKDQIPNYPGMDDCRFEGDNIIITWDTYARSCFMGTESKNFPLSLLWNDDLYSYFKNLKEETDRKEQEAKEKREREQQLKKETDDRKLYEQLKQKFENTGD